MPVKILIDWFNKSLGFFNFKISWKEKWKLLETPDKIGNKSQDKDSPQNQEAPKNKTFPINAHQLRS